MRYPQLVDPRRFYKIKEIAIKEDISFFTSIFRRGALKTHSMKEEATMAERRRKKQEIKMRYQGWERKDTWNC